MKRLLTMLLSAALLVSAFAGCGGEGKESSATSGATAGSSSSNQASTEETDWSSQEPYTVKLLNAHVHPHHCHAGPFGGPGLLE